jgi:hypothetical protein
MYLKAKARNRKKFVVLSRIEGSLSEKYKCEKARSNKLELKG